MIWRLRLGHWRFTFSWAKVSDITGVNSLLPDGNHILMWDFDNVPYDKVSLSLRWIQKTYELPEIHILNTGKLHHYIAYCFKKVSWRLCKEIIASTEHIDEQFFKYGVYREKFTLRVSSKDGRTPRAVALLRSPIAADVELKGLMSWVKYETLSDNSPEGKIEVGRA